MENVPITNTYDFLKSKKCSGTKGCTVCTDKQMVSFFDIDNKGYMHENIAVMLEKNIFPNSGREGWDCFRNYHSYVFYLGHEIYMNFPDNRKLTYPIYLEFMKIIDDFERYVKENPNTYAELNIMDSDFSVINKNNIDKIGETRKKILEKVTDNLNLEKEEIVGSKLSDSEIRDTIKHCFKDFSNKEDNPYNIFFIINDIYEDDVYREELCDLYPKIDDFINTCHQKLFIDRDVSDLRINDKLSKAKNNI